MRHDSNDKRSEKDIQESPRYYGFNIHHWDRWLSFNSRETEKAYWEMQSQEMLPCLDSLYFGVSASLLIFLCLQLGAFSTQVVFQCLDLVAMTGLALLMGALSFRQIKLYSTNRNLIILAFQAAMFFLFAKYSAMLDAPSAHPLHVLATLLCTSSIGQEAAAILLLRFPFKRHVAVAFLNLAIGLLWAFPKYCSALFAPDIFGKSFVSIMEAIDHPIALISSLGTSNKGCSDSEFSQMGTSICWMVSAYLYAEIGFVVPLTTAYCVESYSRTRYLIRTKPDERCEYNRMLCEAVLLACWFAIVLSTLLWAGLRSVPDFAKMSGCSMHL